MLRAPNRGALGEPWSPEISLYMHFGQVGNKKLGSLWPWAARWGRIARGALGPWRASDRPCLGESAFSRVASTPPRVLDLEESRSASFLLDPLDLTDRPTDRFSCPGRAVVSRLDSRLAEERLHRRAALLSTLQFSSALSGRGVAALFGQHPVFTTCHPSWRKDHPLGSILGEHRCIKLSSTRCSASVSLLAVAGERMKDPSAD
ncbi:uncharacterized protein PAN0_002c1056 [Moesziomyces antarcticus]|uniref:uncharacterized protein n=1 Tax=Pseudozyma antarctica TaxID=84753 RepID=UPI0007197FA6|nr:uncharacterized protein PAN0_002c1056 [Moesziomyces antarcticus]GAK62854.1 hypothetical protein PAN0_002c1056 [Moesziomyces antarcticus]